MCRLPRDSCQESAVQKRQQCVLRGLKEIDELPGHGGGDTLNDCFDSFHRAPPLKLNRIAVLRKHLGSHEPSAHECSAWKSFPQRKEQTCTSRRGTELFHHEGHEEAKGTAHRSIPFFVSFVLFVVNSIWYPSRDPLETTRNQKIGYGESGIEAGKGSP
jgi:hypothetical protein